MGLLSGKKGEAVFTEPLLRFFRHNPLPELFRQTEGLNDDRLLAIVTALIVEDRLDAVLGSFLPRYARLTEKTEFTFSIKIALVEALGLIPPNIPAAASIIRKIRNEFAHHLEIKAFTELKTNLVADLRNRRIAAYGVFGEGGENPKVSLLEEYKALAFFCIAGLDAYRENVAYLRAKIEDLEFIDSLVQKSAAENRAELEAILAEKPASVEVQDGNVIERYAKGVVHIRAGGGGAPIDLGKVLK